MIDKRIGQRIKKKRLEAEYTQSELAALCGIKKAHLSDIETGKNLMSVQILVHMVKHLRTSYNYILHGK